MSNNAEAPQNAEGSAKKNTSVAVTDDVLVHAWKVLNPEGNEKITRADLQQYTDIFFPKLEASDLKTLVKGSGMTFEKLKHLVKNHELEDFDITAEAFKVLDPNGTGYVDLDLMKKLLAQMPEVGSVTDLDMEVILELADLDLDGKISVEDFSKLDRFIPKDEDSGSSR
mmetsp:Transcript_35911/g.101718  ORF Transcript_35911/g.101718 Transcript_35911/m.101718 type:complete len:169 (-) Transcript_35911:315-821(-)|eukprot:CAMPEP_0117675080 /NCGR_PEP_ID=MMETSP0804-20121206/15405_1 /TAXON_ID=1074897 /ORGANISM="Tetraselmis astigmatica, Strain CCMP880" /LENGTH=168 /DNA_ID=CAMNT_0005484041 /DNA_START=17 /DNA_END=523 /DNA_ORIENTATION=+